eukprot:3246012-Rhodomonas_salina.2
MLDLVAERRGPGQHDRRAHARGGRRRELQTPRTLSSAPRHGRTPHAMHAAPLSTPQREMHVQMHKSRSPL